MRIIYSNLFSFSEIYLIYISGCNGVSDSVIKAHGRWKSDAYIRYVSVEMPKAGREIAEVFSNIKI
mgnify:CR=1 FL=1